MQLYPALRASMGTWNYYIVKMRMREVAAEVKFGSQVHEDFTLDEAIQRSIKESRVKREIVTYLTGRTDRFFASLVVAAIGGSPKFYPVSVSDDPHFEIFADEESIEQSFGVLRFSGNQDYYALDGQHRLKAIKTLLQPDDEAERVEPPQGFANEEVSVLMVIPPPELTEENWLASYRRLFSSLNRYARPTDTDTNIIMDEDDIFAIITRRLIASHNFFKAPGRHVDSLRVLTRGKALKEGTSHFTSLQQLYDLNMTLLTTPIRANLGWGPGPEAERTNKVKDFVRFRPPEEYIEELFEELVLYWDALITAIPDLQLNPSEARNHQADGSKGEVADNLLFWPIGQDVMVSVARALLDVRLDNSEYPTLEQAAAVLKPLGRVNWGLHSIPWRGLLLVSTLDARSNSRKWTMRNEGRKDAIDTSKRVLRWMTGLYQSNLREESQLENEWQDQLLLPPDESSEGLWDNVRTIRDNVCS
ncbi:MAG: DGQHR domain-containing protein [Caldilineaceae bacterium]|nr:DGQHR domain-containing protein [Caldilineaceae bacterium]